jgi:hypothetical protein
VLSAWIRSGHARIMAAPGGTTARSTCQERRGYPDTRCTLKVDLDDINYVAYLF